jgi:ubiquinone/menaquinone biosynthesis C-methylase UbiE
MITNIYGEMVESVIYDDREFLLPIFKKMIGLYDDGCSRILDVGCGSLCEPFTKTYGKRYVGLDTPSTSYPKNGLWVEGDAHNLSQYPENSFGIVTMFSVLEHLYDPYVGLSEAIRVAKKAVIITTDYTQKDKDGAADHYYAWTPKTLLQLLSLFGKAKTWTEGSVVPRVADILCGVIEK